NGRHRPTGGAHTAFSLLPCLRKVLPAPRRLALLPFALFMEQYAPVPVGVLLSKRVLPSQNRTESPSFPETLVPPRPRSHPNSAIGYQTEPNETRRRLPSSRPGFGFCNFRIAT